MELCVSDVDTTPRSTAVNGPVALTAGGFAALQRLRNHVVVAVESVVQDQRRALLGREALQNMQQRQRQIRRQFRPRRRRIGGQRAHVVRQQRLGHLRQLRAGDGLTRNLLDGD